MTTSNAAEWRPLFEPHLALHDTEKKIRSFQELLVGWDYGQGVPPENETVDIAIDINRLLGSYGWMETDAFPGTDGEIQVTAYRGDDYLEFTIEQNGSIDYVREKGNEEVASQDRISIELVQDLIRDFREELWRIYVSSITENMIAEKPDLQVWPLNRRVTEAESQLSHVIVSWGYEPQSADISASTILPYTESLQSSGKYRNLYTPDVA